MYVTLDESPFCCCQSEIQNRLGSVVLRRRATVSDCCNADTIPVIPYAVMKRLHGTDAKDSHAIQPVPGETEPSWMCPSSVAAAWVSRSEVRCRGWETLCGSRPAIRNASPCSYSRRAFAAL